MRKMCFRLSRLAGWMIVLLLTCLALSGCDDHSSLVGKWKGDFTLDGRTTTQIFEFLPDGTVTKRLEGSNILTSCTYTVKGNTVTIVPAKVTSFGNKTNAIQDSERPSVYTFSVYNDTLTLTFGGSDYQFTRMHI